MWFQRSALLLAVLILCACAKVPGQGSYPFSIQNKMQSAHHWDVLAKEVTEQQILPLFASRTLPPTLYIQESDRSDFGRAFHTYMTSELMNDRIGLTRDPDSPLKLKWSIQMVDHCGTRFNPGPPGVLGVIGYSAALVFAGPDAVPLGPVPSTELLITLQIENNGMVLSRSTKTLYISDADRTNYINNYSVKKGSLVCRDNDRLSSAIRYKQSGDQRAFRDMLNSGECTIISKDIPASVVDEGRQYVLVRSADADMSDYATTHDALQPF